MLSHPFFLMDPGFVREDNVSTGINIGTSQPPLQLGMSMCPSLVKEIKSEVSGHRFNSLWLLPSSYLNTNVMAGVEATILQPWGKSLVARVNHNPDDFNMTFTYLQTWG